MSADFRADMLKRLGDFIYNRELVRRRREEGRPKPWTLDPILQRYRFTNVRREDDKVTRWIDEAIRRPFFSHDKLWFMLCIARLINEPEVLRALMAGGGSWPTLGWRAEAFAHVLRQRAKMGQKITTGVYMITTHGSPKPKPDYLAYNYLLPLWQYRAQITPQLLQRDQTLTGVHEVLSKYQGWGDFLVGQVIADLKHTHYLKHAPDWWDWAVLGPGSRRGLRRVTQVQPKEEQELELLVELRKQLKPTLGKLKLRLCLQDVQNCLCEFDKYERERLGEGHPRNRYDGLA